MGIGQQWGNTSRDDIRSAWEYVLRQNCEQGNDADIGKYWAVHEGGQLVIYLRDSMKQVKTKLLQPEDTFLVAIRTEGNRVKRAYVPWSSIAYLDFLD